MLTLSSALSLTPSERVDVVKNPVADPEGGGGGGRNSQNQNASLRYHERTYTNYSVNTALKQALDPGCKGLHAFRPRDVRCVHIISYAPSIWNPGSGPENPPLPSLLLEWVESELTPKQVPLPSVLTLLVVVIPDAASRTSTWTNTDPEKMK